MACVGLSLSSQWQENLINLVRQLGWICICSGQSWFRLEILKVWRLVNSVASLCHYKVVILQVWFASTRLKHIHTTSAAGRESQSLLQALEKITTFERAAVLVFSLNAVFEDALHTRCPMEIFSHQGSSARDQGCSLCSRKGCSQGWREVPWESTEMTTKPKNPFFILFPSSSWHLYYPTTIMMPGTRYNHGPAALGNKG